MAEQNLTEIILSLGVPNSKISFSFSRKLMPSTLLLLLSVFSFAQTTDENLRSYIKMLNYRPLQEARPKNEALYQLGLRLFYDKQLSGKGNISCHSCHSLTGYSGDTLPLAVGEGAVGLGIQRMQGTGALIPRHTPPLYNLGLEGVFAFFWDGRVMLHPVGGWWTPEQGLNGPNPELKKIADTLDSLLAVQALFPMANPEEMLGKGSTLTRVEAWNAIIERLFNGKLGASYQRFFREAYPGVEEFNIGHAANAIAELERHHFLANNTPWDQYLKGKKTILTERMKRGAILFMSKASCFKCHTGEHLSNFGFFNIGIPQIGPGISDQDDRGLMEFSGNPVHKYQFRTSPLRNVALTAPYMHSGAFATMWEVIEHYNHPARTFMNFDWDPKQSRYNEDLLLDQSVERNMARSKLLARNLPRSLGLSQDEKNDLYCFIMVGLTDMKFQNDLTTKGVLDEISDCSPRISR